ncbi:hypothetical protein MKZ38_010378 [Zalerion maritima]|uniref:Uncharacterized protein n=1 Tax=Zalerion maritima TaxID=339359 RepID=A0AAD5WVV8_9PEZI|nr:hypothetical protein MKZ38_010378 [Zalerion maritima]
MSLNGLDGPSVKEAHETASAEPGGWFLLKYASRDEVDLLGRGNGGIVEIRNAIAQYEEISPLYGFLRYRRRNVIIKFLPQGCSRLVQVCEYFIPHDTTFEITEAKELKDTKLSAACSLHAASGSTSSSTSSLRRRRLMEIAEEEEEQRATKRQSVVEEENTPSRPTTPIAPEITLDSNLATSPDGTKFSGSQDPPTFVGAERPLSPAKTIEAEPRLSSQSARLDIYSSYSSYSSYGRPKVKLGPRPSMDSRPRTAGNYRPISALPAGFKIFSRKGKSKERNELEETIQEDTNDITFNATTIPIPEAPLTPSSPELTRPHTSGGGGPARPSTSSGISVKSFKMTSSISLSTKENKMTPEKARLMKAMQLREKKRMAAMESQPASPAVEPVKEDTIAETQAEGPSSTEPKKAANGQQVDATETIVLNAELANRLSLSQADSGIAIDLASPSATDLTSEDTQTDSHPTSPIAETSEVGVSTKPSSLSDSTDETVEARPFGEGKEQQDNSLATEPPTAVEDGLEAQSQSTDEIEEKMGSSDRAIEVAATEPAANRMIEVAGETDAGDEDQESNIDAPTTPVSPCTIALPVSKFAAKIPGVGEQNAPGMECSAAELTTPGAESPTTTALQIPMSKFSTQDPSSPTTSSNLGQFLPSITAARSEEPVVECRTPSKANLSPPIELDARSVSLGNSRRKPYVDPIRTNINPLDKSEGHLSEDDDLMEELQSAMLQEATHMTVSKSPINPVFPTHTKAAPGSTSSSPVINRTASNPTPLRGPLLAPSDVTQSTARSVSTGAAFLHKVAQQPPSQSLAPKTSKIGSSISQRIKALEKLSATNTSTESLHPPLRNHAPSSAFFSVRNNSSAREMSRSPSGFDRTSMLSPSPEASRDNSPEACRGSPSRDRAASVASRLSVFESSGSNGYSPQTPSAPPSRGRTESIQVTARIVRDPAQPFPRMPELKDPADFPLMDLKQSPLVVDVHKSEPEAQELSVPDAPEVLPTPETPKETIQERRQSRDKRRSMSTERGIEAPLARRSSLSIVRDFIKDRRNSTAKSPNPDALSAPAPNTGSRSPSRPPSTHQKTFSPRRLSISSRRSSLSHENSAEVLSPSVNTEASGSGDEKDKKSKNRASRFIRRLSASLSGGRKNLAPNISPTVREEDASEVAATEASDSRSSSTQTIIAFMGEVNVQFPDNLLWKRRSMCLDTQGFLIISTIRGQTAEKHMGAGVKRYHLSDFRTPYVPDVEIQELPNSVVLDFVDGSGLQVACEDRAGQLNVLHILQDAHQNHTSFGQ